MHWRSLIISAASTAALVVSVGLWASPAASAMTTSMNPALTAVSPDISNALLYPRANEQGGATLKQCIRGADPLVVPPVASVKNNCEYRIYLQQVLGGTSGWSYCINPKATVNVPSMYQDPRGLKIGQAASC
jgi:hypothetical protein